MKLLEKQEEEHFGDMIADIEYERYKEEMVHRLWIWKKKAKEFNKPIKVVFT